jgi:hypothetical protein
MFLGLPDPDPDPSVIKQSVKNIGFVTSLRLFIFENNVSVPSKSTVLSKKTSKLFFRFFDVLKVWIRGYGSGSVQNYHGSGTLNSTYNAYNFQAEGHIAILLPYLGQIQECKDSLLTEEAYTALLQQERQAPTSTVLSADR